METDLNPADLATRGVLSSKLMETGWLVGPEFLHKPERTLPINETFALVASDPEVRKAVFSASVNTHEEEEPDLGAERFKKFSSSKSLQRAVANLIVIVREFKHRRERVNLRSKARNTQGKLRHPTVEEWDQALRVIISSTQREAFSGLLSDTRKEPELPREIQSSAKKALKGLQLYRLDPFLDSHEIPRVGGRLRRAQMEYNEKHPIVLPKCHYVSQLIAKHYHHEVHHQGRHITGGAIRQAGVCLIGGHDVVTKVIGACVLCKKLRGPHLEQRMADLPLDRTEVCPPFTNVGFDIFGPWAVQTRETRGGGVNAKRWGLAFTFLSSRAIHIEVSEAMDSSAFICALRRFFTLRGHAKLLKCDRATNFVGAKTELDAAASELDEKKVEKFVTECGCKWEFIPPYASHFGERGRLIRFAVY